MLMGELATLVIYRLPVKVIILKHSVRGMTTREQIAFVGNPQYRVQLQPIGFAAFAKACGWLTMPPTIHRWWNAFYVEDSTIPAQWSFKLLLI